MKPVDGAVALLTGGLVTVVCETKSNRDEIILQTDAASVCDNSYLKR